MILVTGATGTVGSLVVRGLLERRETVRVLVRDPVKATKFGADVVVAHGDLSRPETLVPAFAGVDRALIIAAGPELPELDANAIRAAMDAKVRHVVKLSAQVVEVAPAIQVARWHRRGEKTLEASGLPWTILRPAQFATNSLHWARSIKAQGAVFQPTGDGRMATIDPGDIAAVAVAVLTQSGHEGKHYALTGPRALSMAEQVEAIGAAIDRALRFVDVPEDVAGAKMLEAGMPKAMVAAVLELMGVVKAGGAAAMTNVVEQVLGRQPREFETWARENAAAFRMASSPHHATRALMRESGQ